MIAVVDYGAANLLSITRALEAVGAVVTVTRDPQTIEMAAGVVLPGVGAAGAAMARMRADGTAEALRRATANGRPLLGLCLGMQLMFEDLEEDRARGIGLLPGEVRLLPPGRKIPHIGWNALERTRRTLDTDALFAGTPDPLYAYFVHSYGCLPADDAATVATCEYDGATICAAVSSGNLTGFQFHPEKSGRDGLRLLANWLATVPVAAGATGEGAAGVAS